MGNGPRISPAPATAAPVRPTAQQAAKANLDIRHADIANATSYFTRNIMPIGGPRNFRTSAEPVPSNEISSRETLPASASNE